MNDRHDTVLKVRDLSVDFVTGRGTVRALRHVDLTVPDNRIVGIVGESGCGKSTLINSVLRLLADNAVVTDSSSVVFKGTRCSRHEPGGPARHPRPGNLHGVPGPHDGRSIP